MNNCRHERGADRPGRRDRRVRGCASVMRWLGITRATVARIVVCMVALALAGAQWLVVSPGVITYGEVHLLFLVVMVALVIHLCAAWVDRGASACVTEFAFEQDMLGAMHCTGCGGWIAHEPMPDMPAGYGVGMWEGWYHLDPTREHFCPVGWYDLRPITDRDTYAESDNQRVIRPPWS